MILVLGAPFCIYCKGSREILDGGNIEYVYVNVNEKLDNWKDIFDKTSAVCAGHKSIPLIFQYESAGLELGTVEANDLAGMLLKGGLEQLPIGWKFVGGKQELAALIDNLDITIDDNY